MQKICKRNKKYRNSTEMKGFSHSQQPNGQSNYPKYYQKNNGYNQNNQSVNASVVLIKKIPQDITESVVKEALKEFGKIKRVKLLMHKYYAYVEFENASRAQVCVNFYQNNQLTLNGQNVLVYLTSSGKNENKPLDLNPPSNILLCTFFKNKIPIGINVVIDVMEEYDIVEKVSILYSLRPAKISTFFVIAP